VKCPVCEKHVDTQKEHAEVKHYITPDSVVVYVWHWPCWLKRGGR
jgi:hypothetical protein